MRRSSRPRARITAVDKYIGARVRMRRRMLHKSQTDLAAGVGLSYQQIQKYENGTNRISSSRMFQIANVLSVPPQFFYEGAGKIGSFAPGPSSGLDHATVQELFGTRDGLDLARAFLGIKDKGIRRMIVALVCDLAETSNAPPRAIIYPKRKSGQTHAQH